MSIAENAKNEYIELYNEIAISLKKKENTLKERDEKINELKKGINDLNIQIKDKDDKEEELEKIKIVCNKIELKNDEVMKENKDVVQLKNENKNLELEKKDLNKRYSEILKRKEAVENEKGEQNLLLIKEVEFKNEEVKKLKKKLVEIKNELREEKLKSKKKRARFEDDERVKKESEAKRIEKLKKEEEEEKNKKKLEIAEPKLSVSEFKEIKKREDYEKYIASIVENKASRDSDFEKSLLKENLTSKSNYYKILNLPLPSLSLTASEEEKEEKEIERELIEFKTNIYKNYKLLTNKSNNNETIEEALFVLNDNKLRQKYDSLLKVRQLFKNGFQTQCYKILSKKRRMVKVKGIVGESEESIKIILKKTKMYIEMNPINNRIYILKNKPKDGKYPKYITTKENTFLIRNIINISKALETGLNENFNDVKIKNMKKYELNSSLKSVVEIKYLFKNEKYVLYLSAGKEERVKDFIFALRTLSNLD